VSRRGGIIRAGGSHKGNGKGAHTAKMVEGGRKEKHVLVNRRLDDGRVGRSGATPELLPLGKVMRAASSSGSRCKRCLTLTRERQATGLSHRQHHNRQRWESGGDGNEGQVGGGGDNRQNHGRR
jgi:hypothetical protein